ncbi:SMI1/KNR4 family protein [Fictibacillus aquaticus]|uniref:Cell wall assembly protein n=1 Tax=Fictibacillus aquaticus TaxID=2021314 RepID=A0A235FDJ9_9BACL|nr:SMI1/KNR4 family protein [Fictibacillus aquaticus]OYD59391.1 cell wall assembly protein [Fictibacillus aquaticus]
MEDLLNFIQTRKPGVSELDLKAAEDKLGSVFPKQYKELFTLVNNAEIGEWILHPVREKSNPKKTWDDIVRQNTEVKDEKIPDDFIAIGEDGSGDKLCFKTSNGVMGDKIYYLYHEDGVLEECAPNLRAFILASEEYAEVDLDDE